MFTVIFRVNSLDTQSALIVSGFKAAATEDSCRRSSMAERLFGIQTTGVRLSPVALVVIAKTG